MTWRVRGVVKRIVDGDTFVADFDLGWGVFRTECPGAPNRVRVLDYDAPEKTDPDYARAIQVLQALIPPGTEVWLESHKLDSFGRALCQVFVGDKNLIDLLPQEWRK